MGTWCEKVSKIGFLWTKFLPKIVKVCRDPNDDHVIATAIAVKAKWIVTGDLDLPDLGEHKEGSTRPDDLQAIDSSRRRGNQYSIE
ncbi:putative toxin-antitoxin system toxin component, PIN family [Nitrospira sp. M1]